jgi:hypothetical protein
MPSVPHPRKTCRHADMQTDTPLRHALRYKPSHPGVFSEFASAPTITSRDDPVSALSTHTRANKSRLMTALTAHAEQALATAPNITPRPGCGLRKDRCPCAPSLSQRGCGGPFPVGWPGPTGPTGPTCLRCRAAGLSPLDDALVACLSCRAEAPPRPRPALPDQTHASRMPALHKTQDRRLRGWVALPGLVSQAAYPRFLVGLLISTREGGAHGGRRMGARQTASIHMMRKCSRPVRHAKCPWTCQRPPIPIYLSPSTDPRPTFFPCSPRPSMPHPACWSYIACMRRCGRAKTGASL